MRTKTVLTVVFSLSLAVAAFAALNSYTQRGGAAEPSHQILAATMALPAGTLLRAQDMTWLTVRQTEPDQIVRPSFGSATAEAKPEITEDATQAAIIGAVLRHPLVSGDPIRRGEIVKPGERDFLQVVLSPGARAIAIPVATGGASTGLLSAGDRVDVILTQNFKNDTATEMRNTPLTRRSVSETVVQNLRILAIDAVDTKPAMGGVNNAGNGGFGRTVTLEVTPNQAEQINVAAELGKLSLTLRSTIVATVQPDEIIAVKPEWAADVSPALLGAAQEKPKAVIPVPVQVFHGGHEREVVKPEN